MTPLATHADLGAHPDVIDLRGVLQAARAPYGSRLAPRPAPAPAEAQQGAWARGKRSYAGAAYNRTTADWVTLSTSADAELYTSLRAMRNRTRQLCRDNEHARNALRVIVNNVIGQGVGMQAEVLMRRAGKLDNRTNDAIEAAWQQWGKAKTCHTAGKLSWAALQRVVIRAAAESGEILIRKVPRAFGGSKVPFALEVIESDQLVDNWTGRSPNGNEVRMGVEVDEWMRPVAYWLYPRHPGDNMVQGVPQSNDYKRVPAEEIIHVGLFDRPNQTRCVPWFHAAMTKLRHIGGTEEGEIVRARASANIMGFITTPELEIDAEPGADSGSDGVMDGERVYDMSPGTIRELAPGETFDGFNPSSPNAALDPFLRYMLRSVAAGIGMSYEALSRDYSSGNLSSLRLGLLDDRDNWRVMQQWLMEVLHQEVFESWLEMAVLSGVLQLPAFETAPEIYQAVRWIPRGWAWIDPLKEVMAYKAAVRCGFMLQDDVVAANGSDVETLARRRKRELDVAAENDLVFDTDPAQVNDKGAAQVDAAPEEGEAGAPAAMLTGGGNDDTPDDGSDKQ
jgi:lambda family phage portal protein